MSIVMSISQRVVILNFGEKLSEGIPESVQNDPEVIAAYLGGGQENGNGITPADTPRADIG
jgi:branched-chain amino acid transport system ATP-binding protein